MNAPANSSEMWQKVTHSRFVGTLVLLPIIGRLIDYLFKAQPAFDSPGVLFIYVTFAPFCVWWIYFAEVRYSRGGQQ